MLLRRRYCDWLYLGHHNRQRWLVLVIGVIRIYGEFNQGQHLYKSQRDVIISIAAALFFHCVVTAAVCILP